MPTCFSIMPFGEGYRDIDRILHEAANTAGLKYVRGDLSKRPGSILAQIVTEIRQAAVVVADITGNNPNVFYELGIAHQILGPDRVVLITQAMEEKKPYDVHQFRQLAYSHTDEGRAKLKSDLPDRLAQAATASVDQESWRVIRGRLSRTRMIVQDLKKLIQQAGDKGLHGVTFRVIAGLSSLAISDREPVDPHADEEYWHALLEERDTLREALLAGAHLKAVLNPPRRFAEALIPARLHARYERMIGLLRGHSDITADKTAARKDRTAMKRCEIVLSPVPMPNLFLIGDTIAYEGLKRSGTGGFEMTHWETERQELSQLIRDFDRFFDDSKHDMKDARPQAVAHQLQAFLKEACELQKLRRGRNTVRGPTRSGPRKPRKR